MNEIMEKSDENIEILNDQDLELLKKVLKK